MIRNLTALASAVILSACANPPPQIKDGVYGIVCVRRETGATLGAQIRVTTTAKGRFVELIDCKGRCGRTSSFRARPNKGGLSFTDTEVYLVNEEMAGARRVNYDLRPYGRFVVLAHTAHAMTPRPPGLGGFEKPSEPIAERLFPLAQSRCRGMDRAFQPLA